MKRLFASIRSRLLEKGHTGKYLKYALGEIILVMIGILLALQVNTWNEERLERKWEQQFLQDLQAEVESNRDQLQEVLDLQVKKQDCFVQILALLQEDTPKNREAIQSLYAYTQSSNRTFFPIVGVYENARSGGGMSAVADNVLKYRIFDLYERHFRRLVYNGEIYDRRVEDVNWERRLYFNTGNMTISDWAMVFGKEFRSHIEFLLNHNQTYVGLGKGVQSEIEGLLAVLESQISTPAIP